MNSVPQTATTPAATAGTSEQRRARAPLRWRQVQAGARSQARHLGLVVVLVGAAVLNTHRLAQNGWANIFYSAGDQSMLRSLHNFLFVSFDPGGLVSVDKPPVALWVQVASAKLFGFTPLSLLLPEAIAGVLAVGVLYVVLARRMGPVAAFAGAAAMAVFPSFVAVSREDGVDAVLILLLVLACATGLRACETGRWRTLLLSGVLVGLAFNTKTLAAYLVVPGIAFAFLLCAPGSLPRRLLQLAVAGLVMVAVSIAWLSYVDLTPSAKRPYVGSSTNNSELGLAFEYNGFGRVEGQSGGPNSVVVRPGARVPFPHPRRPGSHRPVIKKPTVTASGRAINPTPFGGPPGPLRLLGTGLGDQGGWMLPFALFGLLGVALLALFDRRAAAGEDPRDGTPEDASDDAGEGAAAETPRAPLRRDPRLASALVLGGWLLVEAVVLSSSKGIVHPYYVSALAPATGAMAGAGLVAFWRLAQGRGRLWGLALAGCAIAGTVAVQAVLMQREDYMRWFIPVLVIGAVVAILAMGALVAMRRLAAPALVLVFALLLVVPAGYAASTWSAPVEGTFPTAGPHAAAGTPNGFGISDRDLAIYRALIDYVRAHRPGSRWQILTVAADTAAPMMLLGLQAGAVAGYSGTNPALDGPGFARLIRLGEARYVVLGGEYSTRGGNRATAAVLKLCRQLSPRVWHSPVGYPYGMTLFDCAGRAAALAAFH